MRARFVESVNSVFLTLTTAVKSFVRDNSLYACLIVSLSRPAENGDHPEQRRLEECYLKPGGQGIGDKTFIVPECESYLLSGVLDILYSLCLWTISSSFVSPRGCAVYRTEPVLCPCGCRSFVLVGEVIRSSNNTICY